MRTIWTLAILLAISFSSSISNSSQADETMAPPKAATKPKVLETHGIKRIDEYYWLNERENPEVIEYLNAENAYLKAQMKSSEALQEKLFEETKSRIKLSDVSVPVPDNGYEYYSRTEEELQYPIYCRRRIDSRQSSQEEILLDVNKLAEGHDYCAARTRVTDDGSLMAIVSDFVGRRKYNVQFKNLKTGEIFDDRIENTTGSLVWTPDNKFVFYTRQDPDTLRSYQVFLHELGTDSAKDKLVYQESDEEFSCYIGRSRSREYLFIACDQTVSSEYRYIKLDQPQAEPKVLIERRRDHEYSVDHLGDYFYFRTNDQAKNFRLMRAPIVNPTEEAWKEVVPHDEQALLEDYDLFDDYLVVDHRRNNLTELTIQDLDDPAQAHKLEFGEECYIAGTSPIPDTSTEWLRYGFSSMKTPPSTYEYNVETKEKRLLKEQEVLGGFDRENYVTKREWATATDGTLIPVSIVYHKDTPIDGTAPCLQYGYGSYGASMEASFNSTRLNLLDRGFVYAIAHIRGGSEMGRYWYEDGKLLKKMNTFTDFCDVGDFLIEKKYSDPTRLYARGGSAGGLLMGAVINLRPELYHGVIADVPFVDVVTTMLDDSIPLTTSEYDEWGNPNEREYFTYMLSYSPYDNIREVDYPNMLVTTGLHDSQVQYWEPAKWVARLRVKKTDNNVLLLKTNMDAGHGGASGRFDRYKELALRHAFLIRMADASGKK